MSIAVDTRKKYSAEAKAYAFDFQEFPEVLAGETLSAPVVPAVSGLTFGAPAVTTADFDPGEGLEVIPAGKGVKVTISGGSAGQTYDVECSVTTSGGATLKIKGKLEVS